VKVNAIRDNPDRSITVFSDFIPVPLAKIVY